MEYKNIIEKLLNENDVCLFMKGNPDAPQCGFSMAVSNALKHLNIKFKGINVLEDENLRQAIKEFSDWPTIPQLYVKKEFIGGCDIVKEMFEKGYLIHFFFIKLISESSRLPLNTSISLIEFIKFICSFLDIIFDVEITLRFKFCKNSSINIWSILLLYL